MYGARFEIYTNYKSLKYLFSQNDLNLRQPRWTKYMKDYDFELQYKLRKKNVVSYDLGRITWMVASIIMDDWNLGTTIDGYDLQLYDVGIIVFLFNVIAKPTIQDRIVEA